MKKVTRTIAMAIVAVVAGVAITSCGGTSKLQQARDRQYKEKMKEYQREGWKLAGSSKTLEVALLEHYEKLGQGDNRELVGEVSQCQSVNVCKQAAYNNAMVFYANLAGSFVKGRIASDAHLDASTGEEFDKMYAAYERLVAQEIRGALAESYAIVKENGKNKQFRVFFIVSEEAASKARIRALEQAAKETEVAQKYAKQITDFVREGFEVSQ
jgi:hypothetical protein